MVERPKPFVWAATTKDILAKVEKAPDALKVASGIKR
jgi:hypothetical protein